MIVPDELYLRRRPQADSSLMAPEADSLKIKVLTVPLSVNANGRSLHKKQIRTRHF
jgi:hypothetical protein